MKGFEILLEDKKNKGHFMVVAVIAEKEKTAVKYATNEIGNHYEVVKIEVVETGIIMLDSFDE